MKLVPAPASFSGRMNCHNELCEEPHGHSCKNCTPARAFLPFLRAPRHSGREALPLSLFTPATPMHPWQKPLVSSAIFLFEAKRKTSACCFNSPHLKKMNCNFANRVSRLARLPAMPCHPLRSIQFNPDHGVANQRHDAWGVSPGVRHSRV